MRRPSARRVGDSHDNLSIVDQIKRRLGLLAPAGQSIGATAPTSAPSPPCSSSATSSIYSSALLSPAATSTSGCFSTTDGIGNVRACCKSEAPPTYSSFSD
uniref:Uncharacterized protein n=1 Tax=Caenorhabditis japonica TaxID=281687 RepID=A0A8R1EWW7_CAEJA